MVSASAMKLSINIDHIATLRNARGGHEPDPVAAAKVCEDAGADGIVCHLREDRRHIRDNDVRRLREVIRTKLDLEMAAVEEIVGIALQIKPELVTLVPERRLELTTEGGLDVAGRRDELTRVIRRFHDAGILVSLFVNPDRKQIETSRDAGTDMVELHTGEYADAPTAELQQAQLQRLKDAARIGRQLGLVVNAGHGLDYRNTAAVAAIGEIEEVSIGHAIISHAMTVGLGQAVRDMAAIVKHA